MNHLTITNITQLANFLRCDKKFLQGYLNGDVVVFDPRSATRIPDMDESMSIIEKLYLQKRRSTSRSYREIYAVRTDTLKSAHKIFNTYLNQAFEVSPSAHGYVKEKNIRTNAALHLAKKNLLSVDIAHFFENISAEMVQTCFEKLGFTKYSAKRLAQLVTVNNFLPPGFNTSPTISNLIVKIMDDQLVALCGASITYSRYADDLYFSSNQDLPALDQIEAIVGANGFSLNPSKTKYMIRGRKQYVTGLTVFDHVRPRVTKKIKKALRLELHYISLYVLTGHALQVAGYTEEQYANNFAIASQVNNSKKRILNRIDGWIHFMNSVERPAGQKLEKIFKAIED